MGTPRLSFQVGVGRRWLLFCGTCALIGYSYCLVWGPFACLTRIYRGTLSSESYRKREGPACGIPFTIRPFSLSVWYLLLLVLHGYWFCMSYIFAMYTPPDVDLSMPNGRATDNVQSIESFNLGKGKWNLKTLSWKRFSFEFLSFAYLLLFIIS